MSTTPKEETLRALTVEIETLKKEDGNEEKIQLLEDELHLILCQFGIGKCELSPVSDVKMKFKDLRDKNKGD